MSDKTDTDWFHLSERTANTHGRSCFLFIITSNNYGRYADEWSEPVVFVHPRVCDSEAFIAIRVFTRGKCKRLRIRTVELTANMRNINHKAEVNQRLWRIIIYGGERAHITRYTRRTHIAERAEWKFHSQINGTANPRNCRLIPSNLPVVRRDAPLSANGNIYRIFHKLHPGEWFTNKKKEKKQNW